MACFSGIFNRKKKIPDVELETLTRNWKTENEEESKTYALNKDLISSSPPEEIFEPLQAKVELIQQDIVEDFSVLQDKKTFTDYFFAERKAYENCSKTVSSIQPQFEKILELERQDGWEVKMDKDFMKVFTKNEEFPVVKALFNMKVNADPKDLYEILYNVARRTGWDSSVLEYKELEILDQDAVVYYMMNKAPWPFNNREFVEARYSRFAVDGDIEVFYRESDWEYPNSEKAERGHTIFAGQIFRRVLVNGQATLLVTLISQANLGGNIPPKALKDTLPLSLMNWYKSVRKELLKQCQESSVDI